MNVRCALLASLIPLAASAAPKPPEPAPDPAAAAAQHAAPAPRAATRGSNLSAGDQVSIEIIEDKDAPVRKVVSDTGDLDVPYVGRVHVAGKSCAEAETQIEVAHEALVLRPRSMFTVAGIASFKLYAHWNTATY